MLDTKFIRNNAELVRAGVAAKGDEAAIDEFLQLEIGRASCRERV